MKLFIENNIDAEFDFDYELIANNVCNVALQQEKCPFECEINITITDNEEIWAINKETRGIDRPTDVLSFPNLEYDSPAEFNMSPLELSFCEDPETGLVVLGDIVLSYDKITEQANEFGHSIMREYAFLIAHSMLHLCGYDHMQDDEAAVMEERQRMIMDAVNIRRE